MRWDSRGLVVEVIEVVIIIPRPAPSPDLAVQPGNHAVILAQHGPERNYRFAAPNPIDV